MTTHYHAASRALSSVSPESLAARISFNLFLFCSSRLNAAVDQTIAACDVRATIRALILANEFLEHELETNLSQGFVRGVRHGRFNTYSG